MPSEEHREHISALVAELLEGDGYGEMLLRGGYRIGDEYEKPCLAMSLSVSRDHTPGLRRAGDVLRGQTWFRPEMLPEPYRSLPALNGVVEVGIEISLDDVIELLAVDPGPGWRTAVQATRN